MSDYLYNRDAVQVPEVAMVHVAAMCAAAANRRKYSVIPDAWEVLRCDECGEPAFRYELAETKDGRRICETCEPHEGAALPVEQEVSHF